jgi:hypothetical protein
MSPPIGRAGSQEGGAGLLGNHYTIQYMNSYLLSNENCSDNINIYKLKYLKQENKEINLLLIQNNYQKRLVLFFHNIFSGELGLS